MRAFQLNSDGTVGNVIVIEDDANPADFGAVAGPDDACIGWTFDGTAWAGPATPATTIDDLREAKAGEITSTADVLLAAGAPYSGLHISIDDGSRADLTAMAATASASITGALAWPESYSRGWISIENTRIPLPTPTEGLTLATTVGDWYARIVQHRRDLKDAVAAATDKAALAAIDVTAGWPE